MYIIKPEQLVSVSFLYHDCNISGSILFCNPKTIKTIKQLQNVRVPYILVSAIITKETTVLYHSFVQKLSKPTFTKFLNYVQNILYQSGDGIVNNV